MIVKLCGWRPCSGVIVDSCPFYPRLYCTARCAGKEKARVARERKFGPPDSYRSCKLPGCQIIIQNTERANKEYCSREHKMRAQSMAQSKKQREKRAAKREATREEREHARDVKRLEREAARPPKPPKPTPKTLGDLLVPPAKLGRKPKAKPPAPQPGCVGCTHAKPNPEAIDGLECAREVYRTCNPHGASGPKLKEV